MLVEAGSGAGSLERAFRGSGGRADAIDAYGAEVEIAGEDLCILRALRNGID